MFFIKTVSQSVSQYTLVTQKEKNAKNQLLPKRCKIQDYSGRPKKSKQNSLRNLSCQVASACTVLFAQR